MMQPYCRDFVWRLDGMLLAIELAASEPLLGRHLRPWR